MTTKRPPLPPLDPNDVPEIYADELTGVSITNGAVHITYNVVRPSHAMPGAMTNDPDVKRIIVSRIVIPAQVLAPMIGIMQQVQNALQQQQPPQHSN